MLTASLLFGRVTENVMRTRGEINTSEVAEEDCSNFSRLEIQFKLISLGSERSINTNALK